jgi:hypothetical protein
VNLDTPEHPDEVPIAAGRMTQGITRRGGQLLRPMGPWSAAVHEYLRHLESAGFVGAPLFLFIEGEREILTFIDGDVAADPRWCPGRRHRLPRHADRPDQQVPLARIEYDSHGGCREVTGVRFTVAIPPPSAPPSSTPPSASTTPTK